MKTRYKFDECWKEALRRLGDSAGHVEAQIRRYLEEGIYEIGYAHALKKPTILLCDKALRDRLPFDVSGFRTIFYDNSIGGKRRVEEKLEVYLQNINNSLGVAGGSIV